ncbi:MAG: hypothetical protein JWO06_3749 [Bacteroidota bacterium]|nr:hypothetical protein [Bacteroidota bacterium]
MRRIYLQLALIAILFPLNSFAQFTFSNGSNSLELGGYLVGFYQYRPQFSGDPKAGNYSKNTFDLDDARFNIKGYVKGGIKFEMEVNFADVIAFASNINDQTLVPLTEANLTYANPYLNVRAGYFKIPFSPSSLVDKIPSPYLGRATIASGTYFSRRDVGIMVFKDFWHQRINIMAGICSGNGELILIGQNDKNGKPEYFGRVELSSAYYRKEEIDKRDLALPLARIGADIRYNDKTVFSGDGTGVSVYNTGNVMTIDGKKLSYGADAAFMWHGFSAQFEMDWSKMIPTANSPFARQLALYNTKYFRNGGYLVQANYYSKLLRSAFSVRYDEFNPSDLSGVFETNGSTFRGSQQGSVTFAYNFFCLPYNLTIKLHYAYRLKQPDIMQKWKEDELRAGLQYTF